ncbi:hypothetical protein BDZ89DRAFT_1144138 [Hymenopellis radicata]|nr:hypothetical protein BDZ89DRAFT_1144138 [Hymenopellis radicata]
MFETVLQPRLGCLVTSLRNRIWTCCTLPWSTLWILNDVVGSVAGSVAESVEGAPQVLIPVVILTLEGQCLDLFDSMYDLVDSPTFKLRSVPPPMWRIFELTWEAFCGDTTGAGARYAVDYLEEMLPSLDNFVSFGSAHILSPSAVFSQHIQAGAGGHTDQRASGGEQPAASSSRACYLTCEAEMIPVVFPRLRVPATPRCVDSCPRLSDVDEWVVQPTILTTLRTLSAAEMPALRLGALLILVNCLLYYNPALALNVLGEQGSGEVPGVWGHSIEATYAVGMTRKSLEATLETEEDVEDDEDELEGMLNDDDQDVQHADSA